MTRLPAARPPDLCSTAPLQGVSRRSSRQGNLTTSGRQGTLTATGRLRQRQWQHLQQICEHAALYSLRAFQPGATGAVGGVELAAAARFSSAPGRSPARASARPHWCRPSASSARAGTRSVSERRREARVGLVRRVPRSSARPPRPPRRCPAPAAPVLAAADDLAAAVDVRARLVEPAELGACARARSGSTHSLEVARRRRRRRSGARARAARPPARARRAAPARARRGGARPTRPSGCRSGGSSRARGARAPRPAPSSRPTGRRAAASEWVIQAGLRVGQQPPRARRSRRARRGSGRRRRRAAGGTRSCPRTTA